MHYGIQTWGTEGDISPFVMLAKNLKLSGHEVTIVIADVDNKNYDLQLEKYNIETYYVDIDVTKEQIAKFQKDAGSSNSPVLKTKAILETHYEPFTDQLYNKADMLCQTCDVLIRHFVDYAAQAAAEKNHTPTASIVVSHVSIPTQYSPSQMIQFKIANFSKLCNKLIWKLTQFLFNRHLLTFVNDLRLEKGLPAIKDFLTRAWSSTELNLVAVSPAICQPQKDWQKQHQVCGFLGTTERDNTWKTPRALTQFFAKDGPVIFMTLGSLAPKQKGDALIQLVNLFVSAAKKAGCRAIIQVPVIDRDHFPDDTGIYYVDYIPYANIFSSCDVVIHHGGAGTLHHTCKAGVPSVVLSIIEEQFFWGNELKRLGVANTPLRYYSTDEDEVSEAIKNILKDPNKKLKAQQLSQQMLSDGNAFEKAAAILENTFKR